ncbi:erythromycin esterase family protein [Pedobacter aquatilis]|uniref:erythromycin esterase family protein n=1 Tax=Pedobacter aquatilis TaxID=351343 RepID=UPI0025B3D4A1|nr:erythromycin esterase family protein [Pedobacter aquatilis]MDN3585056.1 erythromycin esterase family protein [Pedobacter aquatilis]
MLNNLTVLVVLFISTSFSALAQKNLINELNNEIIAIDSNNSQGYTISKESLGKVLIGNKVIGIGEATHGTKDFIDLRLSLIKNLVENLNYKLIVLECDYSSTLPMNEYICEGKGSVQTALKAMGFWMFNNKDFIATVEWLKAYNQNKPEENKIKFYGCDMQAPMIIYDLLVGKTVLKNPLTLDEKEGLKLLADYSKTKFSKNELENLNTLKVQINLRIQESKESETILNGLHTIVQRVNHKIIGPGKDQSEFRDKTMAENFTRIYKQNKACNTILLAHNLHIRKNHNSSGVSLGSELNKTYGAFYYALGTSFYRGNVTAADRDTKQLKTFYVEQNDKKYIEYTFNKLDKDNFLLDFKSSEQNPDVLSWLQKSISTRQIGATFSVSKLDDENTSRAIVQDETFDGLIFLKSTNALNF